jgi:hypothetical protein
VIREDGSVPDRMVTVQRVCQGLPQPIHEASISRKTGEYVMRLSMNQWG